MEEDQAKTAGAVLRPGDRTPDWGDCEAAPAFGDRQVGLDVAGFRVRARGLSDEQAIWFARRYGIFAAEGEAGVPDVVVDVRRGPVDGFLQVDTSGGPELYRLATEYEGKRLRCWSYRFAGWFGREEGAGGLALCDVEGRGFESSLENFLRVLYATLALHRGAFLLHSAGIVREGAAYLFFGPSGSGKTTTCRLSAGHRVISDDLILVLDDDGPRAASIPFRGHLAELPRRQERFPIAGFYRLIQDRTVRLERLETARAVSELMGSLPFVTERPQNGPVVLEALGRAIDAVPAYRLHFRKDASFWDAVLAATGSA
ncbi:MAG: hypothetical protein PVF68_02405 [Acidobacteriota bacterium]|jgi:hypothetical protein